MINHDDMPGIIEMRRNMPEWLKAIVLDPDQVLRWTAVPLIQSTRGRGQAAKTTVTVTYVDGRVVKWVRSNATAREWDVQWLMG